VSIDLTRLVKGDDGVASTTSRNSDEGVELIRTIKDAVLCGNNFSVFVKYILGFQYLPHHEEIHAAERDNKFSMILGFRGSGKSWIGTTAYILWRIIRNPNIRILVLSKSSKQANQLISSLKSHLKQNDLINIFGKFYSSDEKWSESEFIVDCRTKIYNEPTVAAFGIGSALVSRHYDLIIMDDVIDRKNCRGAEAIKVFDYFAGEVYPMLEPTGKLVFIGTRWSPTDLPSILLEQGGWYVLKIPMYNYIDTPAGKKKVYVWAERFSKKEEDDALEHMGPANFNAQYLMKMEGLESDIIIDPVWVLNAAYTKADIATKIFPKRCMGVDFAAGKSKEKGDYFAALVLGKPTDENRVYVIDYIMKRVPFFEQVRHVIEMAERNNVSEIYMESNAVQIWATQEVERTSFLTPTPIHTQFGKEERAHALSGKFKSGKIRLGVDMIDLMEHLRIPDTRYHDDGFDAIDLAMRGFIEKKTITYELL